MNNKTLHSLSGLQNYHNMNMLILMMTITIALNLFSGGKVFESCGFPRVKHLPVVQDVL